MVKAESCTNDHPLTCYWFGCVLLCYAALCISGETVSKQLCQSRATAWSVLQDLLGLMHYALCVSWGRWTSDRADCVPSRISNGLSSLSFCLPASPLFPFVVFVWNSQHHRCGLFLHVAQEQRSRASLECFSHVFFSTSLCVFISNSFHLLKICPSTFLLSLGFNDLFCKTRNGVLSVTSRERFMSIIFTTTHWRQKYL